MNGCDPMVVTRRARQSRVPGVLKKGNVCRKADTGNNSERPSLSLHALKKQTPTAQCLQVPLCSFAKISHATEEGAEIKQM